ncbi:hypothetical protein CAPTEDRAFT_226031 [Capitella teleta]|uniref:J domain-containing protein n=1 Tax=Capitella teleta TaxID=283909 RepID=R7TVF9_CAPTE|nr:hypothetical protein CAPTEDRAFT_226031 [Capitella teleta]|eukprot:ELT97572.1 hypothetical protein CAPTEDRAFT_226031 [Capitella teleta]
MPGLLEECRYLFDNDDIYSILSVDKSASDKQIQKGYHKLSLQVHPDRVSGEEKENATKKFQALGKIYAVLSDRDKRALYDESGEIDNDSKVDENKDWYEYWRLLFAKISVDDIKQFELKYKGTDEELKDLKEAYLEHEGDMEGILGSVLCCTHEDEPRFRKIIHQWIRSKDVPSFPAFAKESKSQVKKRKRKSEKEAEEAEKARKELGMDGENSLQALILQRNKSRAQQADNFFEHLEQKYSKEKKKTKKTK